MFTDVRFSFLQCMEEHRSFLATCCCLCSRSLKGKIDVAHKPSFKQELWLKFGINVDADSEKNSFSINLPGIQATFVQSMWRYICSFYLEAAVFMEEP